MSRLLTVITAHILAFGLIACTSSGERSERSERRAPSFADLDTNGDGQLSPGEFSKIPHPRLSSEEVFYRVDTDGDGYINREEFATFRDQLRKRINNRRG